MLITRLELHNVKSYQDATVTFTEGTNAICGENGAGKSTLLEAIGFALFDYLPYTQRDFVRQGEKTATIAVSFISSHDERCYQVVRRCGGSSDYFVYDPELNARLEEGKSDTCAWLKDHLGVEPTADLEALFRDAVGVPQGLMTSAFLQTARLRRDIFDPLLHVDEYDSAWNSLRDTVRFLKDQGDETEIAIARLEAEVKRLPEVRQHAERLEASAGEIQTRMADLAEELEQTSTRRKELDVIHEKLDSLQNQLQNLDAQRDRLVGQLEDAQREVAQAEAARTAVEEARPGYEAYRATLKALEDLEKEREARDTLRSQMTKAEKSTIEVEGDLKRLESDLDEVKKAEARFAELEPDVERQKKLEKELEEAKEDAHQLKQIQERVTQTESRLEGLRRRLAEVDEGLEALHQAEADLQDRRGKLEELSTALIREREARAAVGPEIERLETQIRSLEEAEAAQCPVCEQPLTPEHREVVLSRCRDEVAERTGELKSSDSNIIDLEDGRTKLEKSIATVEQTIRKLPRSAERDDLAREVETEEGALAKVQEQIEALTVAPAQVRSLTAQLEELGDPRREQEDCRRQADCRQELEAKRQEAEAARAEILAQTQELREDLSRYDDLDERLEAQRIIRDENAEAHQRYLENVQIAEALSGRIEKVKALQSEEDDLASRHADHQTELEQVTEAYDEEAHQAAKREEERLKTERDKLHGQVQAQQEQLEEIKRDLADLESAQEDLANQTEALQELEQIRAWIEFARNVLKEAGPHITRQLVQFVSLEAGHLFAQIMANQLGRLSWQEDYEIVLEQDGRERAFSQLSGGEQMSAALAVRLALLRQVSDIDVAFFDEPTANLDDARRENLAEEISDIRGFSQLFVISHDDTFERLTNNLVRVRKENGESFAEVA